MQVCMGGTGFGGHMPTVRTVSSWSKVVLTTVQKGRLYPTVTASWLHSTPNAFFYVVLEPRKERYAKSFSSGLNREEKHDADKHVLFLRK